MVDTRRGQQPTIITTSISKYLITVIIILITVDKDNNNNNPD